MSSTNIAVSLPARSRRTAPLRSHAWVGSVLVAGGLVLVLFAGCFLVGVLGLLRPAFFQGLNGPAPAAAVSLSGDERILLYTLCGLALASVLGALLLLTLGLRAFWPILTRAPAGDED